MKKKILITGGCGYIGSSLGNYFSDKYEVITLDKRKKNIFLNEKIKHYICNLLDQNKLKKILAKVKPDAVVHLAGQSTIDLVDKKKMSTIKIMF